MKRDLAGSIKQAVIVATMLIMAVSVFGCKKTEPATDASRTQEKRTDARAAEEKPQVFYSPIDGTEVSKDEVNIRPIAVMVENSFEIRPQEGIGQADMVFEGLTEAGITRLMAVFTHNNVEKLGPVRSARNHFVAMARGFDAIYGHCGGSIFALGLIQEWGVTDFDQMGHDGSYWRVSERKKPHNLFTSTVKIREDAKAAGLETIMAYEGFKHKDEPDIDTRVATQNISIDFSKPGYKVEYKYDRNTNTYLRYNGGQPHLDKTTATQISPKNVLVMFAPTVPIFGGSGCLDVTVVGKNRLLAFIDGKVTEGHWLKKSPSSQVRFYTNDGAEISLNRGQSWVEIVEETTPVLY